MHQTLRGIGLALVLPVSFACQSQAAPHDDRAPSTASSSSSTSTLASASTPRPARERPLDAGRTAAVQGNRRTLDLLRRAAPCPQTLPSAFAKYCAHAADFPTAPVGDIPDGTNLVIGLAAIVQPGPPSMTTLGTSTPVVLVLRGGPGGGAVKQVVLRDPGDPTALPVLLARIGGALDGKWDHVDVPAAFGPQIEALRAGADLSPLERAGGSHWVADSESFEMRRAGNRWLVVGSPQGPEGPHAVSMFVDKLKVLDATETSPQKVQVLALPK